MTSFRLETKSGDWEEYCSLKREIRTLWSVLEALCFCRRAQKCPNLVARVLGNRCAREFYNAIEYRIDSVAIYNKQVERNKTCVEVAMFMGVIMGGQCGPLPFAGQTTIFRTIRHIIPFMKGPRTYLALNLFTTVCTRLPRHAKYYLSLSYVTIPYNLSWEVLWDSSSGSDTSSDEVWIALPCY